MKLQNAWWRMRQTARIWCGVWNAHATENLVGTLLHLQELGWTVAPHDERKIHLEHKALMLLRQGANPQANIPGFWAGKQQIYTEKALDGAIRSGSVRVVDALLSHGATVLNMGEHKSHSSISVWGVTAKRCAQQMNNQAAQLSFDYNQQFVLMGEALTRSPRIRFAQWSDDWAEGALIEFSSLPPDQAVPLVCVLMTHGVEPWKLRGTHGLNWENTLKICFQIKQAGDDKQAMLKAIEAHTKTSDSPEDPAPKRRRM